MGSITSKTRSSNSGSNASISIVPFITGASSFVAAFVVLELVRCCPGPVYCSIRSKSKRKAQQRLTATIEKYAGVSLSETELSKLRFVLGDARHIIGMSNPSGLGARCSSTPKKNHIPNDVTDILDFALSINYRAPAEAMLSEWMPVTEAMTDLCIMRGIRFHYPGSLIRCVADDPEASEFLSGKTLWGGGYASLKSAVAKLLNEKRKDYGLHLRYYDLPFVSGSTKLWRTPENYVVWIALQEMMRTHKAPDVCFGLVPADILATAVVENVLRGDNGNVFMRITSKRQIMKEDMQKVVDELTASGCNIFSDPGSEWDPEVFPEHLFPLTHRVPYEPVGEIPYFDVVAEMRHGVDTYLSSLSYTPEFARAVMKAKKLVKAPAKDLLEIYGLFKQATIGDYKGQEKRLSIEGQARKGRAATAKKKAWMKYAGVRKSDAMHLYCKKIELLLPSST